MTLVPLAPRHVAWRTDAGDVASVRIERSADELNLVALEYRDVAVARDLLEAVAGVATNARVIVGTDPVLEHCGYEPRGDGWVRELSAAPGPREATHAVTLAALEAAIRASWGADTSEEPDVWTADNPAWGNCAVTALVVRDHLGGELVIAGVLRDGARVDRHVWNRLPSGLMLDLTREQFRNGEEFEAPAPLEELLVPGTSERYETLASRVQTALAAVS